MVKVWDVVEDIRRQLREGCAYVILPNDKAEPLVQWIEKVVGLRPENFDEVERVTPSCGCVFCDLDIGVYRARKEKNDIERYWHDVRTHHVECTNSKTFTGGEPRRIHKAC